MSDLREFLRENRDRTAAELADVSDRISETAKGKRQSKLQQQLAFWDDQLSKLPAEPKPLPSSGRASENAVEPTLAEKFEKANAEPVPYEGLRSAVPEHVRTGDPGQPAFLDRGKGAAA